MSDPPLCTLRELQDGTYNLCDLFDMIEALDLKHEIQAKEIADAVSQE